MRKLWLGCAMLALSLAAAGCAGATEDRGGAPSTTEQPPTGTGGAAMPRMSEQDAQQVATRRVAGRVLETVQVRDERGVLSYAVTVHPENAPEVLHQTVFVDASNGQVIRMENRTVLQPGSTPLSEEQARATALNRFDGRVTDTKLLNLDGRAVYVFTVMARNDEQKLIYVDANTGEFVKTLDLVSDDKRGDWIP